MLPLAHIDLGLAADQTGIATTTTLDGSQGKLHLLATVNVGVEDTQNVLEARLLRHVDRLYNRPDGWMD